MLLLHGSPLPSKVTFRSSLDGTTTTTTTTTTAAARGGGGGSFARPGSNRLRRARARAQGPVVTRCDAKPQSGGGGGQQGVNPMGSPNFWEYSSPGDYSSPRPYQTPGNYNIPWQYSPSSSSSSSSTTAAAAAAEKARNRRGGGGGGGRSGGGGGGGGGSESGTGGEGDKGRFIRKVGWLCALFYALLGMIGFLLANSTASLVGGACLSIPFAAASTLMELNLILGSVFGLVFSLLVFAYCLKKFQKSRKMMPAGLLFAFSSWTLLSYLKVLLV